MKILLTNDDGYLAQGIRAVYKRLTAAGHEVKLVAPERNYSGASHSIIIYDPLSITQVEPNIYFVSSTPADSVRLGLQAVYGDPANYPDLVISGINMGENVGEDVLYSGTVGAAREGALHGIPALAFSTNGFDHGRMNKFAHLDAAAQVVEDLVTKVIENRTQLPEVFVWNINIPDIPYQQIQGYEVTKLGLRPLHHPLVEQSTPRHNIIFWQGKSNDPKSVTECEPGTDLAVYLSQQKVSITPIEILPTNYSQMAQLLELNI